MASADIHPDAYDSLNREFYSASPGEYFEMRLRALLTMLSSENAGFKSPGSGGFAGLEFSFGPDSGEAIDRYTAIESTVLLHHTGEALLRLYLAHAEGNPCPWLAIATLRSFSKFKQQVESLRIDLPTSQRQNDLLEVFSARSDPSSFQESAEEVASHRDGLVIALREAANTFLGDSNIYNAAKHGLALLAGESQLSFRSTTDPSSTFNAAGLAVTTLETTNGRWQQKTTWLQVKRSIALIHLWTELIQSLWEAARMRYLRTGDPNKLRRLQADELGAMLAERTGTSGLISFSINIMHVDD